MLIFFLSLFLLIFFEVKCVVDRYKWHRPFQMATTVYEREICRGGLRVSVLDFGANGPGSGPGREHGVVFFGKTLHSHGASLRPGV